MSNVVDETVWKLTGGLGVGEPPIRVIMLLLLYLFETEGVARA